MATIKVNSTSMREKSNSFIIISNSIKNFTQEMTTEVNSLKSVWTGDAGETLVAKFNELVGDLENICDTINSYANFMDQAAQAYDNAENANLQGAQGQQS